MNHYFFMSRLTVIILLVLACTSALAAQSMDRAAGVEAPMILAFASADGTPSLPLAQALVPDLTPSVSVPQMSPELALLTYQNRAGRQSLELAGYSAATVIRAELPRSSQHGEFELERHYVAPHTLTFKALRYIGDGFVKTNVIARLLQSEVDHVQKDDPAATALRPENYKFSCKGTTQIAGRTVHVFQVKPRKKRPGLFKGHIFIDAYTGSVARAEGHVVKSPSLFVKKIEFVQEYADVNGFTLPVHLHTEAKATLVGRTIVDIVNHDYQPLSSSPQSAATTVGSY
jgi:hypothetical protein